MNSRFLFVLLICTVYNSYIRAELDPSKILIMSHRGFYQTYPRDDLQNDTCTAERIYPPTHDFIENTIPSMAKAFELNADAVELDIHSTTDGKIVVFHDWTLECRTNGKGVTQEQTFDYLRSLDIGYGYTADNHASHPFRCNPGTPDYTACKGRNQMPTLREVLQTFPNKRFVINMKSGSVFTLQTLVRELLSIKNDLNYNMKNLFFYCSKQEINELMGQMIPEVEVFKLSLVLVKECLLGYFATGIFQESCKGSFLAMPFEDFLRLGTAAKKLIADIHKVKSKFGVIRVNTKQEYRYAAQFELDWIWTDRIDIVGPLIQFTQVDYDLKIYDDKILEMKKIFQKIPINPFDKEWVKKKISHMVELDQYMRKYVAVIYDHKYSEKEQRYFWKKYLERWQTIDKKNTNDLKLLVEIYSWFTISEFDEKSDRGAWLLVQHADHDPEFQKSILSKLETLYKINETKPLNYAYLFDRVAASWHNLSKRKLQRYATQGSCVALGKWEPIPFEDPVNVDVRRADVGLGTLAENIASVKDICR